MPPVILGNVIFDTKKAAEGHFRQMLQCCQIGERIQEPAANDLHNLIKLHPEFPAKQGVGIDHFRASHTLYGARGFEIIRKDGSTTDFSFYTCLTPRKTDRRRILVALRAEVGDDIMRAKYDYFLRNGDSLGRIHCAVTGEMITIFECHADHAPPLTFANLATAFITARKSEFEYARFCECPTDPRPRLTNRELAGDWRAYHHELANIRLIAKNVNLTNARIGVPNPRDRQLRLGDEHV